MFDVVDDVVVADVVVVDDVDVVDVVDVVDAVDAAVLVVVDAGDPAVAKGVKLRQKGMTAAAEIPTAGTREAQLVAAGAVVWEAEVQTNDEHEEPRQAFLQQLNLVPLPVPLMMMMMTMMMKQ